MTSQRKQKVANKRVNTRSALMQEVDAQFSPAIFLCSSGTSLVNKLETLEDVFVSGSREKRLIGRFVTSSALEIILCKRGYLYAISFLETPNLL